MDPLFEDPVALGEAITKARNQAGMGQGVLAKELGTSRQRLGKIERGEEGEKEPRKPEERRVLAIAVAELTGGDRASLGLSEPEPTEVDQLRREMLDEMDAMKAELLEEIQRALDAQASDQPLPKPVEED